MKIISFLSKIFSPLILRTSLKEVSKDKLLLLEELIKGSFDTHTSLKLRRSVLRSFNVGRKLRRVLRMIGVGSKISKDPLMVSVLRSSKSAEECIEPRLFAMMGLCRLNRIKQQPKCGFTLIELLIATAIASILSISLFYSYAQTNKTVRYTTDYVDTYNKIILIERRFTQDVAGVFIPVQAVKKQKPQSEKKTEEKKPDAAKQQEKKQDEKQKVPLLKDPFVSKNENKNLKMFSFITNNPARAYWSSKSGEPKPSIARVVYTLEVDKSAPKEKPRFTLYRQEGSDLQLAPYVAHESQIERYVIAENIQSCTISFLATDEKENSSEVKEFNDWQIGKDEKDLRSKVKIPETVIMDVSLWNNEYSDAKDFTITVPIAAKFNELPEQEPEKKKPVVGQQKGAERKELLASSANKVVDSIRGLYRT